MSKTTVAMVCAAIAVAFGPSLGLAQVGVQHFDHHKCYKIKDPLKVKHTVDLTPEQTQFLKETGCVVKSPAKFFCIQVQKTNVQPPPALTLSGLNARDEICYALKCPKVAYPSLTVKDQFGQRPIDVKQPAMLCTPAEKVPNIHQCEGPDAAGMCNGTCPLVGDDCVYGVDPITGVAGCGCFHPGNVCPVGQLGVVCGGNCPKPTEDCQIGPDGCMCIPRVQPCGFDRTQGQCGGDCPTPGDQCLVIAVNVDGSGVCQCLPASQACGLPPGGSCPGYCPGPLQVCGSSCSCQ